MKYRKSITLLSSIIIILAVVAASTGIFSTGGPGPYDIETVRGETVTVYGKGLYKHMSQDVAPQGIAQDYVTLFVGVPLLILSLIWARSGSMKGRFLLAGTLAYFLVTYLFYLVMGMYNVLFLVYVTLLGTTFFAFAQALLSFDLPSISERFSESTPVKFIGGFLIFNSIAIGLMWMQVVVPPLLDGSIIPGQVEHYTTLIVQGLDLGLLLPLSFVSGLLFIRGKPFGYLLTPVYFIFLSILMTALTAKVVAMGMLGQNIMPAIVIIPFFGVVSIICSILIFKNIREPAHEYA
ncbi:hypothetical protein SAMN05443144_106170 [Fodinibius roseus]|uniref:Uncharacterized protein n=1 Tax=Fodinibius roseus TaxID=1194090 RepID=A0A1M4ZY21_9BACT|nr:hypothetical protein [Fodinibius roseus]SHF22885.1 hypothetical protein SAMN05443144_106170 [Fodinibius roseus]